MGRADTVSVLHIDRNQLFREGFRRLLGDPKIDVAAAVGSLEEGIEKLASVEPDLIVIDLVGLDPGALGRLIGESAQLSRQPRLVILTDEVGLNDLTTALLAGVDGYLVKDMSADALVQSLHLAMLGETVFPTDLADILIRDRLEPSFGGGQSGGSGRLSGRETEILSCLVNGSSNKEIARNLDIMEGTVKVHLKSLLRKIGAQNRTQAAIWAVNNGVAGNRGAVPPETW
jgi:two-component system, NarL family, nitrate/nitrite response regulator NarL